MYTHRITYMYMYEKVCVYKQSTCVCEHFNVGRMWFFVTMCTFSMYSVGEIVIGTVSLPVSSTQLQPLGILSGYKLSGYKKSSILL